MRMIFWLAAVAAASCGSVSAAQRTYGDYPGGIDAQSQIQRQIDRGIANGVISPGEAAGLRVRLVELRRLDARYGRNGYSASERQDLTRRGKSLGEQVEFALRNGGEADEEGRGDRHAGSGYRPSRGGTLARQHRGERFDGDFRVGQLASAELVPLPPRYRAAFPATGTSDFRYNQGRVYEVERSTGRIRGMFDPEQ